MMEGFTVQHTLTDVSSNPTTSDQACVSAIRNPTKKKRSLPGNPDPNAEVIALSPKSMMATNKFVCEVCGKGFQRDQNLQLHKRGHNLPWKLKHRQSNEVVRKKVYICPEPSCAHHNPSRALGDLTGIKKHFFRKHGEKRWNCERCSKKYAVLSDWKAHSKICGTKEYKCYCGTIFSRRDSFITHKAFCEVLSGENARTMSTNPFINDQNQLNLPRPTALHNLVAISRSNNTIDINNGFFELRSEIPQWLESTPTTVSQQIDSLHPSIYSLNIWRHMKPSPPSFSATAVLQKAAEMGASMSRPSELHGLFSSHQEMSNVVFGVGSSASSPLHQNLMMSSFPSCSGFDAPFDQEEMGVMALKRDEGSGGMTRDFLGLRVPSHEELFSMASMENCMGSSSSFEQPRKYEQL